MRDREFGKLAGLRERLDEWSERLSCDKSFPWVGLGLIDDLQAMVRYMDGERTDPVDDIGTVLDDATADHLDYSPLEFDL